MLPGILFGFVAGGVGSFFFDPRGGARRRALVMDKAFHYQRVGREFFVKGWRDIENRRHGLAHEMTAAFHGEQDLSDPKVEARVRTELGRHPIHHRSLLISVRDGIVTLTGHALKSEVRTILSAVRHVRGVVAVENQLTVHVSAEGLSELQGSLRRRPSLRSRLLLSPGERLVLVTTGVGCVVASLFVRDKKDSRMFVSLLGIGATCLAYSKFSGALLSRRQTGRGPSKLHTSEMERTGDSSQAHDETIVGGQMNIQSDAQVLH